MVKTGAGVKNVAVGDKVFCASGSNEMMCEYFTVPSDCVVKLPDDTTDWAKAVIEPNCCVVNLLYKTKERLYSVRPPKCHLVPSKVTLPRWKLPITSLPACLVMESKSLAFGHSAI